MEEALHGNYLREVRTGAWQGSVLKSAVMALVLKQLHRSGWLDCVKAWVGISGFLRDKLVQGAGVPVEKVFALRHSWDAMAETPGGKTPALARLPGCFCSPSRASAGVWSPRLNHTAAMPTARAPMMSLVQLSPMNTL